MSESVHTNTSLWSKGMKAVIVAQFLSAFGDNALLFATLALLKAQFYPEWSQPILQMVFVGAYILFAPFVGQVADSFAKGRVMMFANGLKLLGAASICFGINPFLGYTLVGVGAAAYSPAKYGILGELTTGSKLVKANGLMEASTIAAILLGSVAGGVLADWHVLVALAACALAYGGAVVANIYIPKLAAARPGQSWNLINMTRNFLNACTSLWRNGETRFSLVGTSLFWGAGVTLRFLLVLWVPVALGITDNATPTYLNAMVAIGIVVGAGAAAKLVTLETVSRCMPAGILIGVVVLIFSLQHELLPAYALLMLIGVLGGFFVVPLNALLQERGKKSVGAGNAIAVQNLGENSAMLLMLGIYSLAVMVGIPVVPIGIGFGALFALAIAALWIWQRRH
ncbi:TPA: lysophospholipid transporter LplT [Escherichia coli]|uniref:lysophospholipid transporter LplT n=1 Tax=Escherichia coli TaxID=562 RepID=UPI000E1C7322|nr:lysophospholipid transporter LplT [Escherichia coli]EFB1107353.1 lysophospholipid transporter LplT [Escherichia coli]EFC1658033.1 lysophospholipid transporter LplT [Escherichia coli]EFD0789960.1 lysophospholipid transporter LplT [Escherichia coli]EFJ3335497.1 lysophospholipid transporter LplT [Escherichia coli]EFN3900963.1 lysophospholipid transporter LplT [Escherichia coli]